MAKYYLKVGMALSLNDNLDDIAIPQYIIKGDSTSELLDKVTSDFHWMAQCCADDTKDTIIIKKRKTV